MVVGILSSRDPKVEWAEAEQSAPDDLPRTIYRWGRGKEVNSHGLSAYIRHSGFRG